MATLIIGVTGKKRSGKDTFAARLVEQGFTRIAFADPLKATIRDLDPWVLVEADEVGLLDGFIGPALWGVRPSLRLSQIVEAIGWEKAKEIREVRRLLQAHGVAIRTHVSPEAWIEAAARATNAVKGPVVIPDTRFRNEARFVEQGGMGHVIRVVRPGLVSTDTHVSETELDGHSVYRTVYNDGTVDDLRAQADRLIMDLIEAGDLPRLG